MASFTSHVFLALILIAAIPAEANHCPDYCLERLADGVKLIGYCAQHCDPKKIDIDEIKLRRSKHIEDDAEIETADHINAEVWIPQVFVRIGLQGYKCDSISGVSAPSLFQRDHILSCNGGKHRYRIKDREGGFIITPD